jgi:hypothetical protein
MGKSAAADQRLWPSDNMKVRFNLPVPKLIAPPGVIRSQAIHFADQARSSSLYPLTAAA